MKKPAGSHNSPNQNSLKTVRAKLGTGTVIDILGGSSVLERELEHLVLRTLL